MVRGTCIGYNALLHLGSLKRDIPHFKGKIYQWYVHGGKLAEVNLSLYHVCPGEWNNVPELISKYFKKLDCFLD